MEIKEEQQKVWDEIASGWTNWRQRPEAIAERLAGEWKPGKILDAGCGNCRNLFPFAKAGFECYGIDFSTKMLEIAHENCKRNGIKVKLDVADADDLPYKNTSFDYVISIAVIHHLDTKESRANAIQEIRRVLKPGGKALISVWNKLQWKFVFKSKDIFMPWHRKGMEYKRYYHFFTHWELQEQIKEASLKIIWSSGPFGRNLQFIAEKR